jgi:hypothetical protein
MAKGRFSTRPPWPVAHSRCMDIIAIVIAVVFFAAMLLFVEGLDRV